MGIAAGTWGVLIEDCYNDGDIIANNGTGTGMTSIRIPIKRCYNKGKITAKYAYGISSSSGEVVNSYNSGEIIGTSYAMGIGVGKTKNSYNIGEISVNSGYICGITMANDTINNCCSMGKLILEQSSTHKGVINYTGILKNCYYLDGIEKDTTITPESTAIKFVRITDDESINTTVKVIEELNKYIKSNSDEVDTKGWCKWVESEEHLPILDFDYEWDPTAGEDGTGAFVKVN